MKIFATSLFAIVVASAAFTATTDAELNRDDRSSSFEHSSAQSRSLNVEQWLQKYTIRIKQLQSSCGQEALQYSGYLDNHETDDHLFFRFYESRTSPKIDPVVLWLNGGPGWSSMMGDWMELGPCLVDASGDGTVLNEYSWNTAANVIFLDQPVNVGYSYGKSNIGDSKSAARVVATFLQLFFSKFSEYARNPFHLAGESYAGHYLPALASEIIYQNKAAGAGHIHIPFESMLIGNGWTDAFTQYEHFETYSCANDSKYKPVLDEKTCQQMRNTYPHCKKLMTSCYATPSTSTCIPAASYCEETQQTPFYGPEVNLNPYDIRRYCEGGENCYKEEDAIAKYANNPKIRKDLGVDDAAGEFVFYNTSVATQFSSKADSTRDFSNEVAETLESGVRVLLFAGDMDWRCNWYGNRAWSLKMKWSGQQGYQEASNKQWHILETSQLAGEVWSHGGLTFLRVFDAGHMVPYDQPKNALDFFNRWLKGLSLDEIAARS